jgi:hypothetical protein
MFCLTQGCYPCKQGACLPQTNGLINGSVMECNPFFSGCFYSLLGFALLVIVPV